jgi:hypothetical protein
MVTLIEPQYEVRVSSIGDRHIGVRIDSVQFRTNSGTRDWRSDYVNISYRWWDVPEQVTAALSRLLARLNIHYAASDFVVDNAGVWHFLEANPHGAWLWLEQALGENVISESIAKHIEHAVLTIE